jgi:hypothetical protein
MLRLRRVAYCGLVIVAACSDVSAPLTRPVPDQARKLEGEIIPTDQPPNSSGAAVDYETVTAWWTRNIAHGSVSARFLGNYHRFAVTVTSNKGGSNTGVVEVLNPGGLLGPQFDEASVELMTSDTCGQSATAEARLEAKLMDPLTMRVGASAAKSIGSPPAAQKACVQAAPPAPAPAPAPAPGSGGGGGGGTPDPGGGNTTPPPAPTISPGNGPVCYPTYVNYGAGWTFWGYTCANE